ncbi:MAG: hypothetical protein OHK0022_16480 [Roseiflexaceae bacterium]
MRRLFNLPLIILAVLTTALKRLRANAGLALCALIALLAAVALSVSVPVYAEAASLRLLRAELAKQEQQDQRSAFALLFRYFVSGSNRQLEWERVKPADDFIRGQGLAQLGLPTASLSRYVRTDPLRLLLPDSAGAENPFLKNVSLGFLTGMDRKMRIVDGVAPQPSKDIKQTVDVMIARELADEMGINVGDRLNLVASAGRVVSIPVRVSGLWEPIDARDPGWAYPPTSFKDVLFVPEETFTGPAAAALRGEVAQVYWFAQLDGENLSAAQAMPLLSRIESVRAQAAGIVQGLRLEQSPARALTLYQRSADELTVQLFVFSVPILALVLYFAALVATLLVNRQRGEIALLKTRGVRDAQILGIYVVEWLLLGAAALAVGPTIGLGFAEFMGRTRSFLQLAEQGEGLPLVLTWSSLRYGVAAVALATVAALIPALVATRRTLVDEQQQSARVVRKPFWQRFYLDFLLLIPPVYGIYQLRTTGGIQVGGLRGADLLSNPLLVLVPVLLCFSLGLIAVRIIPMLLELLARLAAGPSWVAPLVALRALARQPGSYRGPLLLLILTLSLAAFSASMAATLDGALRLAITYQVGAPTQLLETGESTEQRQPGQPGQPNPPNRRDIQEEARFLFVPVSDHLTVPGIQAATRVGDYADTTIQLGGAVQSAQLVGIDRIDFPNVIAHFDREWADGQSLGALMNMLARQSDGVIVSRQVLDKGLKVGDTLPAVLRLYGDQREVRFKIIAVVDLWPGFYPDDKKPLMVANLDYIFDQMGGQYPYDVWIKRDLEVPIASIMSGVRGLGITLVDVLDAATLIQNEQTQPRRQGLFGILSVGFIAAGLLTLLGFLLSAIITARRRAIELGVLRALGLGGANVAVALVVEQVVLVAAGIGAGTGIGLLAATLVVPLLQVSVGPRPGTPSYPPQIAWDQVTLIYLVFAAALLITLFALAWIMGRMRLFQAVKLGDAN